MLVSLLMRIISNKHLNSLTSMATADSFMKICANGYFQAIVYLPWLSQFDNQDPLEALPHRRSIQEVVYKWYNCKKMKRLRQSSRFDYSPAFLNKVSAVNSALPTFSSSPFNGENGYFPEPMLASFLMACVIVPHA